MRTERFLNEILLAALVLFAASCEILDDDISRHVASEQPLTSLEEVAQLLAAIPMGMEHLEEVHDAVVSSSRNGYDEEYTMKHLFECPGAGVGDLAESRSGNRLKYERPLRELIGEYLAERFPATRAGSSDFGSSDVEELLEVLMSSDMQIYWPFSELWDGKTFPVITYDPESGMDVNTGYRLIVDDDGFRHVEEVLVDEAMTQECPVWVVNRNSDAAFMSLEMLRREDSDWGEGGGSIIVKPVSAGKLSGPEFRSGSESRGKSLLLKDFTMKRNYDTWFAGASEFFVKTGAVEAFTATTEAEMKLYNPSVTDFMIVVRRNQVGRPQPFNAMLISDWSEQMTHCAFMVTEDDGGTRTDWKCTALVRVASKSYGVEISLPFNSRDDVVWRGQIASGWFAAEGDVTGHFGDVDLTFEVVENLL